MSQTVIFDLDGTLADVRHRRVHAIAADWSQFWLRLVEDGVYVDRVALFKRLRRSHNVVICTARPDNFRSDTNRWLLHHDLEPYAMIMRHPLDYRSGTVVKRDQLRTVRDMLGPVVLAVDDRPAVAAMYEAEGVPCLLVSVGDEHKSE